MDLLYIAYYLSLFVIPIVLYIVLFSKPKKVSIYSQRDWYHFVKTCCATPYVKKFQQGWADKIKNISDDEQEKPKQSLKEYEADSQIIYGADTKGNYFCLKITLRYSLHAEVSIEYRNNEGKIYRLPHEPQILVCSIASRQWKAAGLNIEVLQPFQRLRITYNGLMRNINRSNALAHSGEVEHVKFHLIWNAANAPLHYPQDIDINLLTEAVTKETWRDGEWINMLGDDYGYDQFGALQGFFNAKSLKEDNYVYMPSWRRRRIGQAESIDLRRDIYIFGILRDGTIFSIGSKSIRMGCTQFPYGSILNSNGEQHSISSNDISLEYLGDNGEIPNIFSVHFVANGKTYKCIAHVDTSKISLSHNQEKRGWISKIITAECDVNSEQANAIITFWYRNSGSAFDLPTSLLKPKKAENPENLYVVQLSSRECLDHELTGGKGNSLGMLAYSLKSNKFEVPPGFVVTVTSFKHQLKENPQLLEAIQKLEDVCYGRTEGEIETICRDTTDLFATTPISQEVSQLIINEVANLKVTSSDEIWRWAVRSSGLDEDSEELSAAGQNSTLLGCTTIGDILKAISVCWGSLFTFQSVQYRRRHGIPVNAEMAVVVQKMVPADSAGVLFTCHPSTGDPTQMVISSNYGLGESVVSASADPDTIILSRSYTDDIKVLQAVLGDKKTKITMDDNQKGIIGTKEVDIEEDLAQTLSITEEQALRLGKIGILLEKKFGNPRDIEWAICNDTLYLLQSRPITTLNVWTDWELQHEFDNPVLSDKSIYTRANVGEVCKGAMAVLSQTVVMKIMDSNMAFEGYGKISNPYSFGPLLISSHTIFLDLLNYMYDSIPSVKSIHVRVIDLSVFGHLVFNEEIHKIASKRHSDGKGLKGVTHLIKLMGKVWNNNQTLDAVMRYNNYWEIKLKISDTPTKMLQKIEDQFNKLADLLRYHVCTSMASVVYQTIAMIILTENNNEFTDEHYTDISLLLATNSTVESAEIPVILEEIAANIRNTTKVKDFLEIDPNDGMNWLEEHYPKIKKTLDEFLTIHGHRLFREFELKEKTWGMDPSVVISMLQANCVSETTTKKARGLTVDETIAQLTSPKKKLTKRILKFFVKKCRQAVAAREKSKSELIKGISRFRMAYTECGRKMALQGYLPEEDLVFHLTHEELKAVSGGKAPGLVFKALRRKRLYEKWDKLHFSELVHGVPIPEQEKIGENELLQTTSGITLKGTPVCQGNVVARACVITDIKDARLIQSGDILITNSTDIAWSPYFPLLSGVVTELGGLISHGAVVAREYGLPCVVGVQNATKYFKTGDKIRLSGKLGLLEVIE